MENKMAWNNFQDQYSDDGLRKTDFSEKANPYAAKNAFMEWENSIANLSKNELLQKCSDLLLHEDLLHPNNNPWTKEFLQKLGLLEQNTLEKLELNLKNLDLYQKLSFGKYEIENVDGIKKYNILLNSKIVYSNSLASMLYDYLTNN